MPDTVEGLEDIQRIYDDDDIVFKECCDDRKRRMSATVVDAVGWKANWLDELGFVWVTEEKGK